MAFVDEPQAVLPVFQESGTAKHTEQTSPDLKDANALTLSSVLMFNHCMHEVGQGTQVLDL